MSTKKKKNKILGNINFHIRNLFALAIAAYSTRLIIGSTLWVWTPVQMLERERRTEVQTWKRESNPKAQSENEKIENNRKNKVILAASMLRLQVGQLHGGAEENSHPSIEKEWNQCKIKHHYLNWVEGENKRKRKSEQEGGGWRRMWGDTTMATSITIVTG